MEEEFVIPNLHVVLVHFPLALLVIGAVIELLSFMWRGHSLRTAGRWMILFGALTAVPTATSGLYALYDVANPSHAISTWNEMSGITSTPQWDHLKDHLLMEIFATLLSLLVVVTWIGCSHYYRHKLHWLFLLVLLGSVGLAGGGAWHAGEAVYRFGVGMESPHSSPTTSEGRNIVTYFAPPLQVHVILAGTTVAIALVSVGLSVRRISQRPLVTHFDEIAAALEPDTVPTSLEPGGHWMPAARFWLLGAIIGLLTAASGYWLLAHETETWSITQLWHNIMQNIRQEAHVIVGVTLVVLMLILMCVVRWMPRQKWVTIVFTLALLLAIVMQVWIGVLMLFDSMQGPLSHFN